jgi:hypothetical protein
MDDSWSNRFKKRTALRGWFGATRKKMFRCTRMMTSVPTDAVKPTTEE